MSERYGGPRSHILVPTETFAYRDAVMRKSTISAEPISAWLLFFAAAFAPLPFGSNEPILIPFWCAVLGVCLTLAPVRFTRPGQVALAGLAGLVAVAYAFVLHEQLAAHPWIAEVSPIWQETQAARGGTVPPLVSIVRNLPWFELGRPFVCILALSCGFLIGADEARSRQLIKVIAWTGGGYATYGIFEHLFDPKHILWVNKEAYVGSLTSTFINRNTAGAYFGSCAVVWLLIICELVRRQMPPGALDWSTMPERTFSSPPRSLVISFTMFFLCLLALFMTGSRAAAALSLAALLLAFILFFWRHLSTRIGISVALVGGCLVSFVLLELMGGNIRAGFDARGYSDEARVEIYRSVLKMIADHPLFGTGQGAFAYAYPAYRSAQSSMSGVLEMAHDTLLEIASDMGIPIAALIVISWIVILAVLLHGAVVRRRNRLMPIAALVVASLAIAHSLIDFSLQIPGYSIVALSLIGAGLAQSFANGSTSPRSRPSL